MCPKTVFEGVRDRLENDQGEDAEFALTQSMQRTSKCHTEYYLSVAVHNGNQGSTKVQERFRAGSKKVSGC
jgi:hypothetical protein